MINDEILKRDKRIAELEALVIQQQETINRLLSRIEELERRLGLNSSNSSKPPSSDGLKKKPSSLREKTGKGLGGQKGHEGKTLKQVQDPDAIVVHRVETCSNCCAPLTTHPSFVRRQVIDIVVSRNIVEHQAEVKICPCGRKNTASFPHGVEGPVQYGPTLRAFGLYLLNHFVPKDRLSQTFSDLFGIPISDTTFMKFEKDMAINLEGFHQDLEEHLKKTPLKHLDETGFRIGGKTCWLHVISSAKATHYRTHQKRGDLPKGLKGTVVHDHWGPYFTLDGVDHVLCNAHHLRELNACIEQKEEWAKSMKKGLLRALKLIEPSPDLIQTFERFYDGIIEKGLEYHESLPPLPQKKKGKRKRRTGHNLLIRLRDFKAETLRFLKNPDIPFTNNQAEQDLRMMKVKQKVSGGFRTDEGARTFAITRSFISTMRKQGENVFLAIQKAMERKIRLTFN